MTQPQQQKDYSQVLAEAAALYAAAKIAPSPLEAMATSAQVAATAVGRVQLAAVAKIATLWHATNPYDDKAVGKFAVAAGRVLAPAQQAVARVTAAARTQQLQAAGVRVTVAPKVPDNVRSSSPTGILERRNRTSVDYTTGPARTVTQASSDTDQVMARAAETYRYSRSQGADNETATQAAVNRIETIIDGNLQITRAIVEQQSLTQAVDLDRQIIGYRRIIHPEMSKGGVCGMCIVAADRIYKVGTLKAIHHRCWCTVLEVYEDYDPGHEMNGDDLEKLYKAASGNTRKQLKRTRYKIVEHSELGPMLVPVNGSPVPYFPAPADTAALVSA